MKIKIVKVEKKDFELVHVLHLYRQNNKKMHLYRRHSPDNWEHFLGPLHGWHRYMKPDILEEAYEKWNIKVKALKSNPRNRRY